MSLSIGFITVLLVDWSKPCDYPLSFWSVVQLFLQIVLVAINVAIMNKLPPTTAPALYQQNRYFPLPEKRILVHYEIVCSGTGYNH